jgi:ribosome recycling factor
VSNSFGHEGESWGLTRAAMLDSVKVTLPDQGTIPLNAVASVTIKQNTLFVEVWDTDVSTVKLP